MHNEAEKLPEDELTQYIQSENKQEQEELPKIFDKNGFIISGNPEEDDNFFVQITGANLTLIDYEKLKSKGPVTK